MLKFQNSFGILTRPIFHFPYTELLMTGTLNKHLSEIDKTANVRINTIICEMAKEEDTPLYYDGKMEHLEWVSLMNNYKQCAEEIIYKELIYA